MRATPSSIPNRTLAYKITYNGPRMSITDTFGRFMAILQPQCCVRLKNIYISGYRGQRGLGRVKRAMYLPTEF